jgi:hypothetical protein
MVRVLASSVVDRGFESRSGQTKYYKIGICCFSTKQGWKALKALIIEKNDNLIWDCKICEIDLHAKESIFCVHSTNVLSFCD